MAEYKKKWVYIYSNSEAVKLGQADVEMYWESFILNKECVEDIKESISRNYDGLRLGDSAAKEVIDIYGYDRVNFVLTNTVKKLSYDGRISRSNKEWAESFWISDDVINGKDMRSEYIVNAHPGILDIFINESRKEYETLRLYNTKHCKIDSSLDFKGRIMVLAPENLKDEYKAGEYQIIYCTGGFGCSPSARGRTVFGVFLNDGEKCRFKREGFIGELKEEYIPDWAYDAIEKLKQREENLQNDGQNFI